MPKVSPAKAELHRPELTELIKLKIQELEFKSALELFSAVARLVPKDEVARNPKAKAALDKEWENLRAKAVWDETGVRGCKSIVEEAGKAGQTVHLGRIFEACYEESSELPPDDPRRKFKGNPDRFALPNKNRPGPHRDKREAKNEKKAQRFKNIESVTERKSGCMTKPVNLVRYDMSSFLESCVDAYCQLAKVEKSSLPRVQTPFTEAGIARLTLDEKETPRRLQPIASKVLMKVLFAARMARPDLLRATQSLASRVTKWPAECDIALHRLVSYVNSWTDLFLEGFVGDSLDDCQLWLFADADHAAEFDSKSTSGCAMFQVGPNTYFPLNAFSKKQTVVANSSAEVFRAEGISMLALFEQLGIFKKLSQKAGVKTKPNTPEPEDPVFTRIDKEIDEIRYGNVDGGLSAADINSLKAHFPEFYQVKLMEDNQASITASIYEVCQKDPKHLFKWTKQQFEFEQFDLISVGTDWQTADILTTPFTSPTKWEHVLRLLGIGRTWINDDGKVRRVDSRTSCAAHADDQGGQVDPAEFQRLLIEFCCSDDSKLCLIQCMTAQSVACDTLKGCPFAHELYRLSRLGQSDLWDTPLPHEYVPGTARPTVNAVPTLYVLTGDSALALITGKGGTLKEYTLEKDFEAKKPSVVLEFAHRVMWGKDFRRLVKANIETIKELVAKVSSQYGSQIRPKNERLRWVRNVVLPPNLELRDMFHALEFEYNRRQRLGYYQSLFHLLHVTDILAPQIEMSKDRRLRSVGDGIFRDVVPCMDELPNTVQNLVRDAYVKISKPTEFVVEAQEFIAEETQDRATGFYLL
eukprot:s114_g14.t1